MACLWPVRMAFESYLKVADIEQSCDYYDIAN